MINFSRSDFISLLDSKFGKDSPNSGDNTIRRLNSVMESGIDGYVIPSQADKMSTGGQGSYIPTPGSEVPEEDRIKVTNEVSGLIEDVLKGNSLTAQSIRRMTGTSGMGRVEYMEPRDDWAYSS